MADLPRHYSCDQSAAKLALPEQKMSYFEKYFSSSFLLSNVPSAQLSRRAQESFFDCRIEGGHDIIYA